MGWILDRMKLNLPPLYTMDIETDPFKRDCVPVPFIIGLFDGLIMRYYRTDKHSDCVTKMRQALEDKEIEPGIIYMHNGGRFDFFYLLDLFKGRAMIIGSRIVRAFMPLGINNRKKAAANRFDFRDSYAIMPFPLSAYQKDKIDIEILDRKNRNLPGNHEKIESYLRGDCVYLWELCMAFQQEFGDFKTIASAAFAQLTSFHKYDQLPLSQDIELRSKFYFGGRVQCFQKGIIEQPVTIYDVNSMYPFVMDTCFHPTGWVTAEDNQLHGWDVERGTMTKEKLKTFFLTVEGENQGAFPQRSPDGSVDFTGGHGIYHVTIHEYIAALQLKRFHQTRILNAYSFSDYARFHLFVDHFYKKRERAKATDDKMHSLFYKYILNSAYGKFGLNPENYFNWEITKTSDPPKGPAWELDSVTQDKYYVWKQPNQLRWNVKNIATAASITGAARALLFRAVAASDSVLYCDTDSIICKDFAGGAIDDKKLGAWKAEGVGVLAAIAGKKMYAVFDTDGTCIKHANKGVDLTPEEIRQVAGGQEILTWRDAPTFKRDGSAVFIHRTARMT